MRIAWRCRAGALLLALVIPVGEANAQSWPTHQFEVYEGVAPRFLNQSNLVQFHRNRGLENADTPKASSLPLSPALKRDMEAYLAEVAAVYDRWGFPPPDLEPLVTRADGSKAYRIYYFDFADGGYDPKGLAVAGYACPGDANLRRIMINAKPNNPSNATVAAHAGRPDRASHITEKGYSDLAHELFHTVQYATHFFRTNCQFGIPGWMVEGQAEAIGYDIAWRLRNINPVGLQRERWGTRDYSYQLGIESPGANEFTTSQNYRSSSYWRYLAELASSRRQPVSPPPKPGPRFPSQADAHDYSYLARLLASKLFARDENEMIDWLDGELARLPDFPRHPDFRVSFGRTYSDFISTFAAYGLHRATGRLPTADRVSVWLKAVFGNDCQSRDINVFAESVSFELDLAPVAAGCIRVRRVDSLPGTLHVDVGGTVASGSGASLYLGTSGGEVVAQPYVGAGHNSETETVNWVIPIPAGETLDLVFSNVANRPSSTKPVKFTVQFTISGWQPDSTAPPAAVQPTSTPPAVRPKTRSAKRKSEPPTTYGPATVQVERNLPDSYRPRCDRRRVDADVTCGPLLQIRLRELPAAMANAGTQGAAGGLFAQIMDAASRAPLDAPTGEDLMVVDIAIPLIEYGEVGEFENALVRVSGGGWPEAVSRGPTDVDHGRLTYFPASGTVIVDDYSELVLRGSFQADLVAHPVPNSHKEDRPTLPVLGRLSGRFAIAQPWRGDERFQEQRPGMQALFDDIQERLPGTGATPWQGPPSHPGEPAGSGSGSGSPAQRDGAGASTDCDCSCEALARTRGRMDELDQREETGMSDAEQLQMAMCLLTCSMQDSTCVSPPD